MAGRGTTKPFPGFTGWGLGTPTSSQAGFALISVHPARSCPGEWCKSRKRVRVCGELCRIVQAAAERNTLATVGKITFSPANTARIIDKSEPWEEERFGAKTGQMTLSLAGKALNDRVRSARVGQVEPKPLVLLSKVWPGPDGLFVSGGNAKVRGTGRR